MAELNFGTTVDMLKNAMTGSSDSMHALSNNIANVNTPGFHRSDVSFKEALAATQGIPVDPDALPLAVDQPGMIPLNDGSPPVPFDPQITVDGSTQMRADKSNVDVDQEMAKLSLNASYGEAMAQFLTNDYTRLRQAITAQ